MADMTQFGSFVPTTYNFDVQKLYSVDVNSPEFKELLVRLYQNINSIALVVNTKESGYHVQTEFVTSQQFFPDPNLSSTTAQAPEFRQVWRLVFEVPALPAGVTNIPHGLTIGATWTFTKIIGAVTNTTTNNYYPLPFVSAAGATNIEVRVDAINIVITNNSGQVFQRGFVIIEYLKN